MSKFYSINFEDDLNPSNWHLAIAIDDQTLAASQFCCLDVAFIPLAFNSPCLSRCLRITAFSLHPMCNGYNYSLEQISCFDIQTLCTFQYTLHNRWLQNHIWLALGAEMTRVRLFPSPRPAVRLKNSWMDLYKMTPLRSTGIYQRGPNSI
jgi:hypothetical protein